MSVVVVVVAGISHLQKLLPAFILYLLCSLQCFDAVSWVARRASGLKKTEWWGAGVVICLEQGADLHMAQLMPLLLTVSDWFCFSGTGSPG